MSKETRTILLGAAALAVSLVAGAQTAASAPSQQAAPATAQAAPYSSAFEGYRPFSADEVGDWRKANETVREIGGWRAYAREIQGGSQAQPGAAAPAGAQQQAQPQSQGAGHGAAPRPAPAASAAPARPAAPANPHQGHTR